MAQVTIYTSILCPYCHMAKELLRAKCVTFDEVDVTGKAALRAEMTSKAGGRHTVPQIWIGERHVGGCDVAILVRPQLGSDSRRTTTTQQSSSGCTQRVLTIRSAM